MAKIALVATRKGLFKLVAQPEGKWTIQSTSFLGIPVSMVLANTRRQDWYAALNHGHFGVKLHRSDDAGQNWKNISDGFFKIACLKATRDSRNLLSKKYKWPILYWASALNEV